MGVMGINEIYFRFLGVINSNVFKITPYTRRELLQYLRNRRYEAVKFKIPPQEFYLDSKRYINMCLKGGNMWYMQFLSQ